MAVNSVIRRLLRRHGTVVADRAGNSDTASPFDPRDFSPALSTRLLILQPTPFCNIDCDYCYLPNRNSTARMDLQTVKLAAERLLQDGLVGPELTVVWHAGEPLTLPTAWYEDAFSALRAMLGPYCNVSHAIQTNATLIDETWCVLFKRYGVRVGVSVDGPADLHDAHRRTRAGKGTHAKVLQGMALLRSQDIGFHAIAVVTPATFTQVDRFADFFEEHQVSELGCNFDEAEGVNVSSSVTGHESAHAAFLDRLLARSRASGSRLRVRELANALQLIAKPLPQYTWRNHRWPLNPQVLPFAMISVADDGGFCTFSPELLGQNAPMFDDFVFGNVARQSYLDAARGPVFAGAWDAIARGVARCEAGCAYFGYCGGGAPANKLYENGDLASAETLYCRSVMKRPFDTVLAQLERERQAHAAVLQSTPTA
jgi:uncharacterized protein